MRSPYAFLSIFIISAFLILPACQPGTDTIQPGLASIQLERGEITLCGSEQYGQVNFPVSCSLASRKTFGLALALLHSFEYVEAEKAFVKVIEADPECVMAYWGVAMSNYHALWLQAGTNYLEKGSSILKAAEALPKTVREKDYLDAISAFYNHWENTDHKVRVVRFEHKMQRLHEKYKDDREAAIFYALALRASSNPADKTYSNQIKSGKLLESIFSEQPNHPGIAHYIIHNYDYPELAQRALLTARKYAEIAPSSAHAQHMPSHIFTQLGLWDESISTNLNSINSARCYAQSIDPEGHWDEEFHGMDYLVYAYLQKGENAKAIRIRDELNSFRKVFPANFKVAYSGAAITCRIALENKDWNEAAKLELPALELDWNSFPWQKALIHFARALGSLHNQDLISGRRELDSLRAQHQKLLDQNENYFANQLQIQITIIEAWTSYAMGDSGKSISLMRQATDMENNTEKHPATPGEILPAGELLGDMLLALDQPIEALKSYENNLIRRPGRLNGLYGAASAAESLNDSEKATLYYKLLLAQLNTDNCDRPEKQEALAYIRQIGKDDTAVQ